MQNEYAAQIEKLFLDYFFFFFTYINTHKITHTHTRTKHTF
jgi:hypothetical protein